MATSPFHQAVLSARPKPDGAACEAGMYQLGLGKQRDGELYIPRNEGREGRPLIVLLHGAGGDGASMRHLLQMTADEHGWVLLLPDARKHTWDYLLGGFGPDVSFIDRALEQVFARCRIDPSKLAIGGFSDGASYALTLGLANGDLFTHVMAFSPGFMSPPRLQGTPRVFLSHGVHDRVLPIDPCSRRIVPQLEKLGYAFTYREFDGPHTVPPAIVAEASAWFLADHV